ncbi:MAG: inositol monophosphatase family protein [Anaerolineales bacterium]
MSDDRLKLAIEWARGAGEILLAGYGHVRQIETKSSVVDLVTEHDLASEAFLLGQIQSTYPQDAFLAEESGQRGSGAYSWVIDPLDGTTNFAHGLPLFAVSIACLLEGQPILGVVYAPAIDELFTASESSSAQLNGSSIHVSEQDNLDSALMVTGFPYDVRTRVDNNLGHYRDFALRTQGVRRFGSAALDLCYVAAGRFDGYWEVETQPWDYSAGALIVRQAGGTVTQMDGRRPEWQQSCSIVATNGTIHSAVRALLSGGVSSALPGG